jgi:hypothetical protein
MVLRHREAAMPAIAPLEQVSVLGHLSPVATAKGYK